MEPANQPPAITIRPLTAADAVACDEVIRSLPYHFGHEGGRRACAEAVRTSDGRVAVLDDRVVGFLTVERHYDAAAEITWMAVHADHRGRGIGRALVLRLIDDLRTEGRRLLLVLTLSDSYDEGDVADSYARTRAFYRLLGFIPARELPLWDQPALLFVLALTAKNDGAEPTSAPAP